MKDYVPTIGLEIHAELKTKTKMFCGSLNDSEEKRPNVNICEVCMAEPGSLPTINKQAVKNVLKIGLALNGKIADFTEFDRKNYFYPDIPKGYQISQYKYPLVQGGELNGVSLTRIHLEEDTAKSTHQRGDFSLVDFNRAGVPLMELVTEPVIKSAEEASGFARELQMVLRYLDISDADMEKGNMRVEVNISIKRSSSDVKNPTTKLGTKVEIKNLNSFKTVEKAIEYEIKRQTKVLEEGSKVVQETRGWNEIKQETFSQRIKEDSHDYRYFPDPDLPKLFISQIPEFSEEALRKEIPELPKEKRARYKEQYNLTEEDAEFFIRNKDFDDVFKMALGSIKDGNEKSTKLVSNYIISDLAGIVKEFPGVMTNKTKIAEDVALIVDTIITGKISSRGAKDVLRATLETNRTAKEVIGTAPSQINDEKDILGIVMKVMESNKTVVEEYKKGKTASLQYLIGQAMKESRGKANPEILRKILVSKLV